MQDSVLALLIYVALAGVLSFSNFNTRNAFAVLCPQFPGTLASSTEADYAVYYCNIVETK